MPNRRFPMLKFSLIAVLVAASALTLRGSNVEHRAHLSRDLVSHLARHAKTRARVIVHGSDAQLDDIARRQHLQIVRRVAGGAVFAANADELNRLAGETGLDNLSGDLLVRNTM